MCLFNDLDEKYDIILRRDVYQNIELGILNSTRQLLQHKLTINIVPAGYWASDQRYYKQQSDTISNVIENEEANYDIAKIISNNYKKVDFDVEIARQT